MIAHFHARAIFTRGRHALSKRRKSKLPNPCFIRVFASKIQPAANFHTRIAMRGKNGTRMEMRYQNGNPFGTPKKMRYTKRTSLLILSGKKGEQKVNPFGPPKVMLRKKRGIPSDTYPPPNASDPYKKENKYHICFNPSHKECFENGTGADIASQTRLLCAALSRHALCKQSVKRDAGFSCDCPAQRPSMLKTGCPGRSS